MQPVGTADVIACQQNLFHGERMMQLGKSKGIKVLSAVVLSGVAIATAVLARAPQPQERLISQGGLGSSAGMDQGAYPVGSTRNPLSPEQRKAFEEQEARIRKVENQACLLLKQRRFAEAEVVCRRLLAMSPVYNGIPDQRSALHLLGDIYLAQGRNREALAIYHRAVKHTGNIKVDLHTALAWVRLGELETARKFYNEVNLYGLRPKTDKERAEFLAQLPGTRSAKAFEASIYFARANGGFSFQSGQEEMEDYQKALRLFPRNGLFAYRYAEELMYRKRYDEAVTYWARAATFGKGETALDAKKWMNNHYLPTQREQIMKNAAKIK